MKIDATLKKELRDKGKCVVVVLHDIAQAVRVADRLILLADGESVYCGQSEDFAKSGALENIWICLCIKLPLTAKR